MFGQLSDICSETASITADYIIIIIPSPGSKRVARTLNGPRIWPEWAHTDTRKVWNTKWTLHETECPHWRMIENVSQPWFTKALLSKSMTKLYYWITSMMNVPLSCLVAKRRMSGSILLLSILKRIPAKICNFFVSLLNVYLYYLYRANSDGGSTSSG